LHIIRSITVSVLLFFSSIALPSSYVGNTIDLSKAIDVCNKLCRSKSTDIIHVTEVILKEAKRTKINPNLILAIAISESNLNPKAIGPGKYSKGLMQVNTRYHMPKFVKHPLDIEDNVRVGTDILKECKVKHKGNFNKTIFCYRGLKDTKYLAKINRYMQYNVFPLV
jgi:soluble lytic murein transglycosylase-like protein